MVVFDVCVQGVYTSYIIGSGERTVKFILLDVRWASLGSVFWLVNSFCVDLY